jgi:hypothetical protein
MICECHIWVAEVRVFTSKISTRFVGGFGSMAGYCFKLNGVTE